MDTKKVLNTIGEAQFLLEQVAEIIRQANADDVLDTIDPKALILNAIKNATELVEFGI